MHEYNTLPFLEGVPYTALPSGSNSLPQYTPLFSVCTYQSIHIRRRPARGGVLQCHYDPTATSLDRADWCIYTYTNTIHAHTKLYLCRLTKRKSSTHVIVKIRSFHSLDLLCSCRATIVVLYTFIPTGTSKSCSKLGIIRVFDTSFGVN